jgi:NAD(P)-dependent dehydrogenase (short-subunit alcohol dehydrogenase family)
MSKKVWLVTGSSRGLGRDIALAILASGDKLVATARDPRQLQDLVDSHGDQVRAVALDVTDPAAAITAVRVAVDSFGRLDVLVNNAGYGDLAPFEQTDDASFRAQMETNLFGVVNVTRAALPVMRGQRAGRIIQISSVGGRMGAPGVVAYQAAKWAVGGFSEALQQEVGALGIQVSVLEPGGMRTGWGFHAKSKVPAILPDYLPTVGAIVEMMQGYAGNETGDPAKVAQVVLRLAYHAHPPLHLLLGSDAVHYAGLTDADRAATGEQWKAVSVSTDVAATGPIPAMPDHQGGDTWHLPAHAQA